MKQRIETVKNKIAAYTFSKPSFGRKNEQPVAAKTSKPVTHKKPVEPVHETAPVATKQSKMARFKPDSFTFVVIIAGVISLSLVALQQYYGSLPTSAIAQSTPEPVATVQPAPTAPASPKAVAQVVPTATPVVTVAPTAKPTATPTMKPTTAPTVKPTVAPTPKAVAATPTATQAPAAGGNTYTVQAGDSLWKVAEKVYNDGFKWQTIAKANNITDARAISAGMTLTIPKTDQPAIGGANTQNNHQAQVQQQTITPKMTSYTIVAGDNLWMIAEKAYGNPYLWKEIATANNITNPSVIYKDTVLRIPPAKASP